MAILILLLKKYWPYILGAIAIISLITYIQVIKAQRDHYKEKYAELVIKVKASEQKEEELKVVNESITKKYAELAVDYGKQQEELNKSKLEVIKRDKESRGIKLSDNVIRLFNSTKSEPQTATTTKSIDVGETSTTTTNKQGQPLTGGDTVEALNLNDLLVTSASNDLNHNKCIKQVESWQQFWIDYTTGVNTVYANPP